MHDAIACSSPSGQLHQIRLSPQLHVAHAQQGEEVWQRYSEGASTRQEAPGSLSNEDAVASRHRVLVAVVAGHVFLQNYSESQTHRDRHIRTHVHVPATLLSAQSHPLYIVPHSIARSNLPPLLRKT